MFKNLFKNKTQFVGFIICSIIGLAVLLVYVQPFLNNHLLLPLERGLYDVRFKLRGRIPTTKKVVVVDINEETLERLGRWPFPRYFHAKIVDNLVKSGAKTIAFDILFTEPERDNAWSDQKLADSAKRSKCVIQNSFIDYNFDPPKITLPIPVLKKSAAEVGIANAFPQTDGVVRALPPLCEVDGKYYPHLSFATASHYLGKNCMDMYNELPLTRDGEVLVNYLGPFKTVEFVPYWQVYMKQIEPEHFKDKIVIIGATATGLYDHHPQPFSPHFPGVEIQATLVENFITNSFIHQVPGIYTVLSIILLTLLCGFTLPILKTQISTVAAPLYFLAFFLIGLGVFNARYWFELAPGCVIILLSYVAVIGYRLITEEKEKKRIRQTFGTYVSPQVLNFVLSNPPSLGGARQKVTIFFSDIRAFTSWTETTKAEEVVTLLNEYLTKMTDIVFQHNGTVDKFIGDAIMAFWGAPLPQEDHAFRAVSCAIDMIVELKKFQEELRRTNRYVIDIGIGINTGDAIVGNMGSNRRMDYTVIGDSVNLAARLEPLNRKYDTHVIIGSTTYELVKDRIITREIDKVKVKGKDIEQIIYEAVGYKK
ncbi:MAG: adenylate/guanylate cyclase domain-containing protein [Elusimicrobiota bacterium]